MVHPYSSMDMTTVWKKLCFILSDRSSFHMTDSLSIAVHVFTSRDLLSFSVDETLIQRQVNLFTSFRDWPFSVEMSLFLILIKAHVFRFVSIDVEAYAACCLLQKIRPKRVYLPEAHCVISVVCVRNSLYRLSSASCKAIFFHWIYRRSKYVVQDDYELKSVSPSGERTFTFVFL